MTYFFVFCHSERSEESHNLSEEYILRTFSVGYFANAQYDVLFAFSFGESGLQAQRSKTIGDKSVR